jgi:crotonobetainyl-CoA:carnitine CoA-transferase CaiB-like acyl-CoA transferase
VSGVYDGIRVLDCTEGIAGPTATMHLADFGADVLKVETRAGDRLRDEPGYLCFNRNKRFTRLDPGDYRDLAELRRLISAADAAVFDWPLAELERWGLDATSVRAGHPELTYAWMPPHGRRGRWAHLPAEPSLLAAVSGVADFHRAVEDRPVLPVVPVLAYVHGALGATAVAAGLLARRRGGSGRTAVITGLHAVAALQAAVTVNAPGISAPGMRKVGVAALANYAPYRCSDGLWLFLGALTEAFFFTALDVIGLMEVMVMPGVEGSYANILRPEVSAAVLSRMQERFGERDRSSWLQALDKAGVPVAPVSSREEWFGSETVAANGLRLEIQHPHLGPVTLPGIPLELSATPATVRHLPDDSWWAGPDTYWQEGPVTEDGGRPGEQENLPLEGVQILDASSFVAGTFGPSILAQYGAAVIKLEPPTGDPYRAFSGSFAVVNQAKLGISLDITTPAHRRVLEELLARADVFVENLRPASRRRLGLDWNATQAVNARLVHCSMGAYGRGPLSDKPGFDPLLQARSGLMQAQGGVAEPAMSSMLVHDIAGGSLAAVGILAALYHREISGIGQHVATSLAHASVMVQAGELTSFNGSRPSPAGGRDWPGPGPYRRLYRCADGWICLWASGDASVTATDRALKSARPYPSGRGWSAEGIAHRLQAMPVSEALDRLTAQGVAAARVLSRHDVFTEPWLRENEMFHPIPDPQVGAYYGIRGYTDWIGTAGIPPCRSFSIGEDTADVLASLADRSTTSSA